VEAIAAISTPPGYGGIGIIRISGKDSFKIIEKIFKPKNKEKDKIKNYYYPLNIFPSIEEALKYVIKQSSKKCRFHFIGSNERLPKIIEKIVDQNIFYYNNFKTFLITKYIP